MANSDGPRAFMLPPAIGLWGFASTVLSLVTDFLSPIGPIALWFFAAFTLVAAGSLLVSRLRPDSNKISDAIMKYCLIGMLIFGLVLIWQAYSSKEDSEGIERGALASTLPVLTVAQDSIMPTILGPQDEYSLAMREALKSDSDANRKTLAQHALSSPDPVFAQHAVEQFYRSGNSILRQQAIMHLLTPKRTPKDRYGRNILIAVVTSDPENDQTLNKVNGATLRIRNVDQETGSFSGQLLMNSSAISFNGAVSQNDVKITTTRSTFNLIAEDDFHLRGPYVERRAGITVPVEIPLN